jgi:hypothetical protein
VADTRNVVSKGDVIMLGKWGSPKKNGMKKLIVTLPAELAQIIENRAQGVTQTESEIITEMLTEALIYCHGKHESPPLQLNSPIVRMANAVLVHAIDSGVDTLQIIPARSMMKLRYLRKGELIDLPPKELIDEMPLHLHKPLFNRYEHMAGTIYGPGIRHPEDRTQGWISLIHSGATYDVGVRFLAREPGANGETLELTFGSSLELNHE